MDRFQLELPDLGIDLNERLLQPMDAIGRAIERALTLGHGKSWTSRRETRQLLAQFTLNGFHLSQQAGRLSVKPQDVHFAVHALGNRHYGLIDGVAGQR